MADTLIDLIGRLSTYQTDGDEPETRYRVMLAPEGLETSDGRYIEDGALSWRDGPLPLMWSDTEMGHGDAVLVGNFDNMAKEQIDGVTWAVADADFDLADDNEAAQRAKRLVDEGRLNGVSIHMADMDADFVCEDEGTDDETCRLSVSMGVIAAVTIVAIPAFEDANIEPVAASAGEIDLYRPPREWFNDPGLDEPTFLTVTDDGRVYGHLFTPDSCHLGFPFTCETPPHGDVDYDEFNGHARVTTDDGANIPTGVLTYVSGHAGLDLTPDDTVKHYDQSGSVAAYVRVGEDSHGAWIAGAVAPGLSRQDRETVARLSVSGDWRPRNGRYMLAAVLSVPVPGFGIRAKVASGEIVGLVTGSPTKPADEKPDLVLVADAIGAIRAQMAELRTDLEPVIAEKRQAELDAALAAFD